MIDETETKDGLPGPLSDSDAVDLVTDPADLEHLAGDASFTEAGLAAGAPSLVLGLEDLLPDVEGEVVVHVEDDLAVSLVTNESLASSGIADHHVTASGVDVDGLYYYSFANGLTLYSDTDIVIVTEASGA
jgi:hypothetical protein